MRVVLLSIATALVAATPAMANEASVEARTGINWLSGLGFSVASAGVAGGYDMEIGSGAFAGVEVSGDKLLVQNADVIYGGALRIGGKVSEAGKLYAIGGYETTFKHNADEWTLGGGYQHSFGKVYVKAEYRRHLDTKLNTVLTGIGVKF